MKKRLIPLSVGLLLSLTFISGCSNPDTPDPTNETTRYGVTYDDNADYKVVGLNSSGYRTGDTVTFAVVSNNATKVVSAVSSEDVAVTSVGDGIYTFVMPTKNVNLAIEMQDDTNGETQLATALAEARDGVVMDTVYEEHQQYFDTHGKPSGSPSRYAKRVVSEMIDGYSQVTRYTSVYDYSGDLETPIDVSETEADTIYIFAQNPNNGYLSTTYLGIDNTLHYSDVLDSANDANLTWYQTFANPFSYLEADDFTVDAQDANKFHLNVDDVKLQNAIVNIAQIIFGDIQLAYHVEDFAITLSDGKLASYEGEFAIPDFEWYESKVYFSGAFTKLGASSFTAPTVSTEAIDATLEAALTNLKKQNYTVEVSEASWGERNVVRGQSDGGTHFLQDIYATDVTNTATASPIETYYYKQIVEYDDFTELNEYSVQQAVKIRDEFYKFSSDRDGVQIAKQMLPSFELSSSMFDKNGSTYTLKSAADLPYYFMATDSSLYSPFTSNSINSLEITLGASGEVTFETTDSYGAAEVVTYTKVGSTAVSEVAVNTNTSKLTKREDYLKTEAEETALNEAIPTEIINVLPTPSTSVDETAPIANVTTTGIAKATSTSEEGVMDTFAPETAEEGEEALPPYLGSWSNDDGVSIDLYDDGTGYYGWFDSFTYTVEGNTIHATGDDFIITMTFDETAKTLTYVYEESTPNTATIAMALDTYGDNVDLQYDDLLVYFSTALGEKGFTYNTENLYEYEFNKTMSVGGQEFDVTISLGGSGDLFVVVYETLAL